MYSRSFAMSVERLKQPIGFKVAIYVGSVKVEIVIKPYVEHGLGSAYLEPCFSWSEAPVVHMPRQNRLGFEPALFLGFSSRMISDFSTSHLRGF